MTTPVRRSRRSASTTLEHVHPTRETVTRVTLSPPHPPREETPEYAAAHHFLVHERKRGCEVCGVTVDTLSDPARNPFHATAIETHHAPVERSLAGACDWRKVHEDFPSVYDQASFLRWVDSPENLAVLCDQHHRSLEHGIHHLLPTQFSVQKYLLEGYLVGARVRDAVQVQAADERLLRTLGLVEAEAPVAAAETLPAPEGRAAPVVATVSSPVVVKPVRVRKPRPRRVVASEGAADGQP